MQELVGIFKEAISSMILPITSLLNIMATLGKKDGGSRCIAISASFYRLLLSSLRPLIRRWDRSVGSPTDSALVGRSPLVATALRSLILEDAARRSLTSILVLWDVSKFFDSMDFPQLIPTALSLGFPGRILAMGALAHRAPRVLKLLGTHTSCITDMGRSILAGCSLSTSLARA